MDIQPEASAMPSESELRAAQITGSPKSAAAPDHILHSSCGKYSMFTKNGRGIQMGTPDKIKTQTPFFIMYMSITSKASQTILNVGLLLSSERIIAGLYTPKPNKADLTNVIGEAEMFVLLVHLRTKEMTSLPFAEAVALVIAGDDQPSVRNSISAQEILAFLVLKHTIVTPEKTSEPAIHTGRTRQVGVPAKILPVTPLRKPEAGKNKTLTVEDPEQTEDDEQPSSNSTKKNEKRAEKRKASLIVSITDRVCPGPLATPLLKQSSLRK